MVTWDGPARRRLGKGSETGRDPGDDPVELRIDGTVAGRSYQAGTILPAGPERDDGSRGWWVPMLNDTERLGVLQISTAREDDAVRETPRPWRR
jgi:hypothetical protein